ncbi:hypothetical protein, partial [Streptomyces sp. NPDC058657]
GPAGPPPAREEPRPEDSTSQAPPAPTAPSAPLAPLTPLASAPLLDVFCNQYLAPGATEGSVIVGVRSADSPPGRAATSAPRALVFLLGLSHELPEADFRTVTRAVRDAVDSLEEGVRFAVVAGSAYARMLYPDTLRLVPASPTAKAAAHAALARLEPVRDAAFGRWVRLADRLFAGHPDALRTAILLADMKATAEPPEELAATLASCAGRFTCHARGIGVNWEVRQLTSLASALNGTTDLVHTPADLAPALAQILDSTRQAVVRDLALRITAPDGTRIRSVQQVAPTHEDLSFRGYPIGPGAFEYPIDAPDDRQRDYHLLLDLPPGGPGATAPVGLDLTLLPPTGHGQSLDRRTIPFQWTDDDPRSSDIPPRAARYTGQEELARAIQEGLDAARDGGKPSAGDQGST